MIIGVGFVSYAIGSLSSIMLSSDSKTQNLKVYIYICIYIYIYLSRKSY